MGHHLPTEASSRTYRSAPAPPSSIESRIHDTSEYSSASRGVNLRVPLRSAPMLCGPGATSYGIYSRLGGEYKDYLAAIAQLKFHHAADGHNYLLILFALYGKPQVSLLIMFSVLVTYPKGVLLALKWTHTDFSVFFGARVFGADGGRRCRPASSSTRSSTAAPGSKEFSRPRMTPPCCACADTYDRSRGLPGPFAGGHLDRDRQRFAKTLCDRHRRRIALASPALRLLAPVLYALVARKDDVPEGIAACSEVLQKRRGRIQLLCSLPCPGTAGLYFTLPFDKLIWWVFLIGESQTTLA